MDEGKITTKDVLKVLAITGVVVASIAIPNLPMALGAAYKQWKNVNRKDLGRIIKRLQKQEMLEIQEDHGKIRFIITERGKRRLLEYDFENLELKTKKRDGKWRLIIFDIPEDKKKNRDAFSKKLRELGCIRLQDSVYASAFPCKNEIDFMCHFLGISDFVTLASLDKIERGEELIFKKFMYDD